MKDERLFDLMTSRMEKMLVSFLNSNETIESSEFIRMREGRFIWKARLSYPSLPSKRLFIKAVTAHKNNMREIILYKENPVSLRSFFPKIYHAGKQYGFYWLFIEELESLPFLGLSESDFKGQIQLIAALHAKHYNEYAVLTDKEINWIPSFKKDWNKRINKLWLLLQLNKYMRNPKTSKILAKDYSFFKRIIFAAPAVLKPLLKLPHSVIHGCLTPHHFMVSSDDSRLKLVDWATVCFAPFTVDLVDFVERCIREYASEKPQMSDFRQSCISLYLDGLSRQGIYVDKDDFIKWYEITLQFKIIGEIIWKELKKISKGEDSKYYWYRGKLDKFNLLGYQK